MGDMIFPPRCPVCDEIILPRGGKICKSCQNSFTPVGNSYCNICGKPLKYEHIALCPQCRDVKHSFDECRAAFIYDDIMRKSIYRYKYNGRREYSAYYAQETVRLLGNKINQYNADALIPVPIHPGKERKRGFNQAYLLAKEISNLTNIPVLKNYVKRDKSTKIMRSLGAKERQNNLKKAFKIDGDVVKLTNAIIVDDIYTTGATMDAVAACLKDAGAVNVYGICLSSGMAGK